MQRLHPFILCADDYAIAPGVSDAIRRLLAAQRISATSCMSVSSFWAKEAPALKPFSESADIGLHLTLTDQAPLSAMPQLAPTGRMPSLGRLMRLAVTRRLPVAEIRAELSHQIDSFIQHFGTPPAFLDGHQHVHQLPVVRDIVLMLWREKLNGHGYLRSCRDSIPAIIRRGINPVRALVIGQFGRDFYRAARKAGAPTNESFRGVYDFSGRVPYAELFPRFLENAHTPCLVMCHPGRVDAALEAADSLTMQRETEYDYFLSDAFPTQLERSGFRLARYAEIAHR